MTPPGTKSPPHNPQSSVAAPGSGARVESSLDSQIDALLSDSAAPEIAANGTVQDSNTSPSSAAADAEAAVASIEKQVESLVDQFVDKTTSQDASASIAPAPAELATATVAASTVSAVANAEPTAVPESIGDLDDQLARLTDELLTAPAPEAPQQSSMKFAPTPEEPPAPAATEPAPQIAVTAVAAPVAAPIETQKPTAMPVIGGATAAPNKFVQVFAKPLAGKPRLIRDTVGWLGFNSMFLAGVVWSYHLWFQKPEKPVAQHAPAALVSSDGHGEAAHGEAPAEGHGAPAGGEAHAGDNAGGEHASAESASDEPITGVNPLHKKKPTYALSDAMAEKLNIAKKADAGHGGGGHGAEKKSSSGHGAPPKSGH